MTQHLTKEDIVGYVSRTLEPGLLLAVDAHLAVCDACFEQTTRVGNHRHVAILASVLDTDPIRAEHLPFELMAAYVDERSGEVDREIVVAHVVECGRCAAQIQGLIEVRDNPKGSTLPARAVTSSNESRSTSEWWSGITAGTAFRFLVPMAAAILIGAFIWAVLPGPTPQPIVIVEAPVDTDIVEDAVETETAINENSNSNGQQQPTIATVDKDKIEIDAAIDKIKIPSTVRELQPKNSAMMGETGNGTAFALTEPVGKIVMSDRPHFSWRSLKDAESYVVTIHDRNFNKIAESPPLQTTAWTPDTRLKRGLVYQWQVTATKDGKEIRSPVFPAPEAKFKVLDANAASEIDTAKRSGTSHLAMGILYANAGLLADAEREFQLLVKQYPRSEGARHLLNKVRAVR